MRRGGPDDRVAAALDRLVRAGSLRLTCQPCALACAGSAGSTWLTAANSRSITVSGLARNATSTRHVARDAAGQDIGADLPRRRMDRRRCGATASAATAQRRAASALPLARHDRQDEPSSRRAREGPGSSRAPASARRSGSRRWRSRSGPGGRPRRSSRCNRGRWRASSRSPGGQRLPAPSSERRRVALSMPFATRCDDAVRRDVGQAGTANPITDAVDSTTSVRARPAEDRELVGERLGRVHQRERLVGPLVAGQPELDAARPETAGHADRRVVGERCPRPVRRRFRETAVSSRK